MELPRPLVSTNWLAENINDPDLLIFDVSIYLEFVEGRGNQASSGKDKYLESHIHGAQFLDLIRELSDADTTIPFMMPAADRLARILEDYGVGDNSKIVIYNDGVPMWSTRLWWMIRSIGFDSVSVLDGGWQKWQVEDKPVDNQDALVRRSTGLTADPQPQFWADKATMTDNIESASACTINALSPQVFTGELNQYGRPGHIPGSHNVYYGSLLNKQDGTFVAPDSLRQKFENIGALGEKPVITYCGGGISATMDALMLFMLGKTDVAVYDGSMAEWTRDAALPLSLGEAP
ncbi:MAG: thiosulfate/3-mercaptopyruvate sulfurtransferase [Limisphaerales bacterium]|jgi:thiosulfate/3-mercaptopyruvate sulfurtransferase